MINRLPKKYREKYKKKRDWSEDVASFVLKVVGSTALLFVVAAGVDIYHLMQ